MLLITNDVHSIREGSVHNLDENRDRLVVVASYVLGHPSCNPLLLDRMLLMDLHEV